MIVMEAEKVLLKQLQRFYSIVLEQQKKLSSILLETKCFIEAVKVLSEQYCALQNTKFDSEPFSKHIDLKKNLTYKIVSSIEENLIKLHNSIEEMESLTKKVEVQSNICHSTYQRHNTQFDYEKLTEGTPTRPSIAILMEWSEDIMQYFHTEYGKRKFMLENISYNQQEYNGKVVQEWSNLTDFNKLLGGILPCVTFFLKEET